MSSDFTHITQSGDAHMVDVGQKAVTERTASAESFVSMTADTLHKIIAGEHHKGDVFAVSRVAGIQAAKKCSDLIPLCHPLMLTGIEVTLRPEPENLRVHTVATCKLAGKTGVEMEALTAASVAALTVYDMCKALDKAMEIGPTRLILKTGGKSGDWERKA